MPERIVQVVTYPPTDPSYAGQTLTRVVEGRRWRSSTKMALSPPEVPGSHLITPGEVWYQGYLLGLGWWRASWGLPTNGRKAR